MSPILLPLLAFTAAAGLLTITPGADTAMVLRASAADGPRAGVAAALGICLGLLVWGIGAAFGLTALLAASVLAFTVLKWLGAAYLVYLGVRLLLRPRSTMAPGAAAPGRAGGLGAFRRGLLTNLLNPNVAAFSLLLAGVHVVLSLVWLCLLVAMTVPLARVLARPAVVRGLDRLTGCVFVGFGLRLALSEHP
jgi:threonine/homoserine/homoserine lactone efflux protein